MLVLEHTEAWGELRPRSLGLEQDVEEECTALYRTLVMTSRLATAGVGHHVDSYI